EPRRAIHPELTVIQGINHGGTAIVLGLGFNFGSVPKYDDLGGPTETEGPAPAPKHDPEPPKPAPPPEQPKTNPDGTKIEFLPPGTPAQPTPSSTPPPSPP